MVAVAVRFALGTCPSHTSSLGTACWTSTLLCGTLKVLLKDSLSIGSPVLRPGPKSSGKSKPAGGMTVDNRGLFVLRELNS